MEKTPAYGVRMVHPDHRRQADRWAPLKRWGTIALAATAITSSVGWLGGFLRPSLVAVARVETLDDAEAAHDALRAADVEINKRLDEIRAMQASNDRKLDRILDAVRRH